MQAEALQHFFHVREHGRVGRLLEMRLARIGIGIHPRPALVGIDPRGDVDHVGTAVGILRQLGTVFFCVLHNLRDGLLHRAGLLRESRHLQIARHHRGSELVHLAARVVNVELARHVISRKLQHPRHGIPKCRPAPVAQMHGPCGVGRDELEVHSHALARVPAPEVRAACPHVGKDLLQRRVRQAQVHETRTCHLDRSDGRICLHVRRDFFGYLARRHVRGLC